ncbi:MAG: hypothetical protein IJ635_02735 [Bacteroidaceae bacterium]|nr:hypothetical protein [Bacteroidaceae bacterium]
MKKFVFICIQMWVASSMLWAQETADSVATDSAATKEVQLEGVTVKAARVMKTVDGMKVFPSQAQLEASADGYSLLQKLSLPGIRVDEVMRTITAPEMIGSVQVRINDVPASTQDLLSLEMGTVQSIDFITSPGLRYGDGVAYVIDIHVLRPTSGYVVGGEVLQAVNRRHNSDNLYLRMNRGKSEFSFNYDFGWTDFRGYRSEGTTDYILADGTTASVINRTLSYKNPFISNGLSAKYSLAEDEKYLFLATLSQSFGNSPSFHAEKEVIQPLSTDTVTTQSKDRTGTTQLDLYFNLRLPHAQTLTANAVGTYVGSRYGYSYDAVSPYIYNVRGRTYSLTSEWLYENRFKPFTFSVGFKQHQQYLGNEYTGDLQKDNPLHNSGQYLYAQLRGKLFGVGYKAGMGVSHVYYSQQGGSFNYWLPRPKVTLNYSLTSSLSLSYDFEMRSSAPRIAQLTDVTQMNERVLLPFALIEELSIGNPTLKTNPDYEHQLRLDYDSRHVTNSFLALYRNCHRTRMQDIARQTLSDGTTQYIFSRTNQGSVQMIYLYDYLTLHLIPEKFDFTLYGTFLRCFNFGDHYTHLRNTLMGGFDLNAYLGKFTLSASYDSGWHFLEGEGKGDGGYASYLGLSYRLGKLGTLSLFWQHPFDGDGPENKSELLNRYLHKTASSRNTDFGNMVSLRLTLHLSHGRRYTTEQQTLKNTGVDSGVVKHE